MSEWLRNLTAQGRVLVGVAAAAVLVGSVTLVVSLAGDDPSSVRTAGSTTSTEGASRSSTSTTSTSSSSPSTSSRDAVTSSSTAARAGTGTTTATTKKPTGGATTAPTNAPTTPTPAPTQPAPAVTCNTGAGSWTNQLAIKFCAHRASLGLPTMKRTAALDALAQDWANQLAANHNTALPHRTDLQSRTLAACSKCNGWAENIAWAPNVDGLWQSWLNSTSHRQNIENGKAGEFGFGVAQASDGTLFGVQNFGRYP